MPAGIRTGLASKMSAGIGYDQGGLERTRIGRDFVSAAGASKSIIGILDTDIPVADNIG